MMNCDRVVQHLDDFMLDLLETDARSGVEAHLRSCESCGRALEKARETWAQLDEWQPKPPTSRASKSTRRALPQLAPPPWAASLAIASGVLIMAALAVAYYGSRPTAAPDLVEERPAHVEAPLPAPPEKAIIDVPATERPKIEKPAPVAEAVTPPVVPPQPIPPAPRPVDPPAESKDKKAPEPPAPAPGKTVAASVARVERVKGDVRAGTRRATEGMDLSAGERLVTQDKDSLATVRLSDSIQVTLAGATEIATAASGEVFVARGVVDVEARGGARRFATFNAAVEVAEARFTLEKRDDVTLLQVRQGTVQFTNFVTGKLLQAKPGQNVKAEGHPKVDQRKVDAAVANGIAFLRGRPLAGLRGGTDELELVLYTLLHGGVPDRDPEVQTLLKNMLALEPQKTYNTALRAMVLEKIDRVRYQEEIWKCAQYLLDNQSPTGQWGYGTPTTYGPMPKRVPTGTATGGRPKAVDFSDKTVRHRVPVVKKRDGVAADNSNSQYAALGLRACHDAGIDLPKDAVTLARKWLLDCQAKEEAGAGKDGVATGGIAASPRGWGYTTGPVYGSMTSGAIGSVCIYDYILEGEKTLSWKRDPAVLSGIAWLANNFSPTGNPGVDKAVGPAYSLVPDGAMYYYYLYAVERTGLLFGTEKFGAREWYPEGAAVLLKNQQADGSWPPADTHRNAVWDTCFSILFLRRATRPLQDVASEDSKSKK